MVLCMFDIFIVFFIFVVFLPELPILLQFCFRLANAECFNYTWTERFPLRWPEAPKTNFNTISLGK